MIDYIFKRYGRQHTALLGSMSTFRDRSTYRELGKVYGLPKHEIDELSRTSGIQNSTRPDLDRRLPAKNEADFPNIRSIHAGGILISEEPINVMSRLICPLLIFNNGGICM